MTTRNAFVCALLVVAACEHGNAPLPRPRDAAATENRHDVGVATAPHDLGVATSPAQVGAPVPPVVALDVACESCHVEIAAEWRASVHASAATHPVYRAEHALTNATWCNRCHAPLADPAPMGAAAERGVGCTLCHAPHDGHAHPEALAPRDCASCHDAPFPTRAESAHAHYATDQRLQRTHEEWLTSAAAARGDGCTTCHFTLVRGADGTLHTSHASPGGRADALWRDALDVHADARRTATSVCVRVTLAVRHAGHAVPTGDMYRRLLVRAEPADADPDANADVTADADVDGVDGDRRSDADERDDGAAPDAEQLLMRRFGPGPHGTRQIADDRVPADGTPRVVTLTLPRATTYVRWSVTWLALDPERAAQRHLAPELVRHDVASGELTVRR